MSLEDALTSAVAVLKDAMYSAKMPCGLELAPDAASLLGDAAFELEELREKVRLADGEMPSDYHKENQLIQEAKVGVWNGSGSVSEIITVALVMERHDLLPTPYTDVKSAWLRLNDRQQRIVKKHAPGFTPPA